MSNRDPYSDSQLDLEVGSLRTTDSVHQHLTEAIGAPT